MTAGRAPVAAGPVLDGPVLDALASSIARRAVDLARDARVRRDDGTEHLLRLARGRRSTLEQARDRLVVAGDQPAEVECALLLLRQAIDTLPTPD